MRYLFIIVLVLMLQSCQQNSNRPVVIHDTVQVNNVITQSAADKKPSPDALIEPGRRIGHISIGETQDSVVKKLGRPDAGDAAMGKELCTWYNKKDSTNRLDIFSVYADTTMRTKAVKQIHITSPYFKTANNIGVGAPLSDIRTHFPALKLAQRFQDRKTRQSLNLYTDINKGIAYEITINSKDSICSGIIVFKEGEEIIDMYINPEIENLD